MKLRGPIIMTILLALLAGFYFWDSQRVEKNKSAEQETKKLFAWSADKVTGASITRAAVKASPDPEKPASPAPSPVSTERETIKLEKRDSAWFFTEPLTARADQAMVKEFMEGLTAPSIQRRLGEQKALKDFGLDPPRAEVILQGPDGAKTLAIGDPNPIGSEVYVKLPESADVLMADAGFNTFLSKSVQELRDRSLMDVDSAKVRKIELTNSKGQTALENRNDKWVITGQPELPGDRVRIDDLLNQLQSERVADFVEESPQDLTVYGLDKPALSVTLSIGEEMAQKQLIFGKQDAKMNYFVKRAEAPNVFTVRKTVVDALSKSGNDLRDHTLIAFDRDKTNQIKVTSGQAVTVLHKTEPGKWQFDGEKPADAGAVGAFLGDLAYMRCVDFLPAVPEGASQESEIELTQEEQTAPAKLTLYGYGEKKYAAAVSGGSGAVTLSEKDAAKLRKRPFDFRNNVLSEYNKRDLRGLEITKGEEEFKIEGEGEKFTGKAKDGSELSSSKTEDLIWAFDLVKMSDLAEETKDLAKYGLDKPQAVIKVKKAEGEPYTLRIGAAVPEKEAFYVKRDDREEIGIVEKSAFSNFFGPVAPSAAPAGEEEPEMGIGDE